MRTIPLLVALVLLAAPGQAQGDTLFDQSFSFSAGDRLEVSTSSPTVVIETGARRDARVRVEGTGSGARDLFEHLRFTAERRGNRLVVGTNPRGSFTTRGRAPTLRIVITIPEQADVNVQTSSGRIVVGSLRGDVRARASSGAVELGRIDGGAITINTSSGRVTGGDLRASGDISMHTSSGAVRVGAVRAARLAHRSSSGNFESGPVDARSFHARTSSGTVTTGAISGESDIQTSSGRVRLASVGSASTIRTSSGSVEVGLARSVPLNVRTSSGAVTITAPRDLRATLDFSGRSFDVASGFDFRGERGRRDLQGTIGASGGPRLEVRTSSGRIRLERR